MNKLSRKFILGIAAILFLTTAVFLYINSALIQRYYLHEKKADLSGVCDRLEASLADGADVKETIAALEASEEVTIAGLSGTSDLDSLNEELRAVMRNKGIGFQKFWLWDQGYQDLLQNGRKISLYNQGKLNYSLLVEYMEVGTDIYAVAMIIPHLSDAIQIINTVTAFVMLLALLVAVLLVAALVRRITKPLDHMKQLADDIAVHHFHPIEVNTHDELETVAASMNQMCTEIHAYQEELLNKNRQMSELLDNVAHDLKTPVALVKAYAGGMKDGMDDGTFLDTIIRQNDRMSEMIEQLLYLSRLKKRETVTEKVALDRVLKQILEEHAIILDKAGLTVRADIVTNACIDSNEELVTLVFDNLISNAIKYSSGKVIDVLLKKDPVGYVFEIKNDTDAKPDMARLWDPFYVGEASRNKELSGTGLGLTLVKNSAEKTGARVYSRMGDGEIVFGVVFGEGGIGI